MGRPTKENSRSPQDVIAAAIACLDQEGEAALGVNRVARELGIKPPAICKHLDGNTGLRRAVALAIWRDYLAHCQQHTAGITEPHALLQAGAQATRNFARSHPARYRVMMQYQMQPTDPQEVEIIQNSLRWFQTSLQLYELNHDALIDVMRTVNAAIYGFITREQSDLMTLDRSSDASYEVMLNALVIAIKSTTVVQMIITINGLAEISPVRNQVIAAPHCCTCSPSPPAASGKKSRSNTCSKVYGQSKGKVSIDSPVSSAASSRALR